MSANAAAKPSDGTRTARAEPTSATLLVRDALSAAQFA